MHWSTRSGLAVAVITGAIAMPAGPAFAADTRPCVSRVEYQGLHEFLPKAELERRWEVKGLGTPETSLPFGRGLIYPRCGYSLDEAYYWASFEDGEVAITGAWKDPAATLHGRP